MTRPSVYARTTIFLAMLMMMGLIEAGVVLYVQRETGRALDEADRTEAILLEHAHAGQALAAMRAADRGAIITGEQAEIVAFEQQWEAFQRSVSTLASLIRDSEQRARLDRASGLAAAWKAMASALIDDRLNREDVAARLTREVSPQFEAVRRQMDAFERRQLELRGRAAEATRLRLRNATIALTGIPALAIAFIVILLLATERTILRPLRAVAQSARRLRQGDYESTLPPAGTDEIGLLISAFDEMRTAVRDRAAEALAAQRRIRADHIELRAVIETVPAALVIVEADGSMRLANRAAERLLGRTPDTPAARRAFWQGFTIRDRSGRPVRIRDLAPVRALAGAQTVGEELEIITPDGRRLDIIVAAAPLRDENGRITAAVAGFQDIGRLREVDRLKDEFVAVVSHELRTPLTAIRGALQLLIGSDAVSDPDDRQLLVVALKSCERLVRIVNDILDLSKIEAGRLQLKLESLETTAVIDHAVEGVRTLAREADVTIVTDVPAGVPAIRADADRITQAIVNLLSNAIKFAPGGSTVTVSGRAMADAVAVSVTDQGRGIARQDLDRLFQKFQQLDAPGTRKAGGTGLGLSITKGIVEAHGGSISVNSVVGEGTTFTFTVPRS